VVEWTTGTITIYNGFYKSSILELLVIVWLNITATVKL